MVVVVVVVTKRHTYKDVLTLYSRQTSKMAPKILAPLGKVLNNHWDYDRSCSYD